MQKGASEEFNYKSATLSSSLRCATCLEELAVIAWKAHVNVSKLNFKGYAADIWLHNADVKHQCCLCQDTLHSGAHSRAALSGQLSLQACPLSMCVM